MAKKYDKETMIDVMNLMFDNVSWPIWRNEIDRIKKECEIKYERLKERERSRNERRATEFLSVLTTRSSREAESKVVDMFDMMFDELLKKRMAHTQRELLEGYWSEEKGKFFRLVEEMKENYETNITIERDAEAGIHIRFDNYLVENKVNHEMENACVVLPAQAAAVYAAILKLGYFDMTAIVQYYSDKAAGKETSPIREIETVKYFYDIVSPGSKGRNDKRVENALTGSFSVLCNGINTSVVAQLQIDDPNNTLPTEIIEKIRKLVTIQAQLNGRKYVGISSRRVNDKTKRAD